jgi:hypothetical protein
LGYSGIKMTRLLAVASLLVLAAACARRVPQAVPDAGSPAPAAAPAPAEPPASPQPPAVPDAGAEAAPPSDGAAAEAARAPARATITFAAVGDVMLGSSFPDETGGLLPPDDGKDLLAEVAPILSGADVAFGNLEGPLVDAGQSEKCARSKPGRCYAFRVPTRYGKLLLGAGFDVFSLANNHAGDFGDDGRASTRRTLDALGIRYAGAPGEVARLEVRGTRIALVAFSTSGGTNDVRDLDEAARVVEDAGRDADLVVVSFHGGAEGADRQHVPPGREEFLGEDRGDVRAFARAVIAAGADLVLGHGPHVVRGMEVVSGRLVAYSLGNFATYGGFNLSGPNGLTLVLEVRLAPDGTFLGGRIHPGRQERPGGPRRDPAGTVIPVVRRLSAEDFGAAAVRVDDDGNLAPPGAVAATQPSGGTLGLRPRVPPSPPLAPGQPHPAAPALAHP